MTTKVDPAVSCSSGCQTTRPSDAAGPEADKAPIVCTLERRDLHAREREMRAVFVSFVGSERTPRGFQWTFRDDPDVEAKVRSIARSEAACCAFAQFEVMRSADRIVLDVSAAVDAREALEALRELPAELAVGDDALARALDRAGLRAAEGRD